MHDIPPLTIVLPDVDRALDEGIVGVDVSLDPPLLHLVVHDKGLGGYPMLEYPNRINDLNN